MLELPVITGSDRIGKLLTPRHWTVGFNHARGLGFIGELIHDIAVGKRALRGESGLASEGAFHDMRKFTDGGKSWQ